MSPAQEQVRAEASRLSQHERAELARWLLLSLEVAEDTETGALWADEAEHRLYELTSGSVEGIPHASVMGEARAHRR